MKLPARCALPFWVHGVFIVVGVLAPAAGCKKGADGAGAANARPLPAPKVELGSVACLATRWHPDGPPDHEGIKNVLLRELLRQGVLIAIREEMGLVTRDETLQEPFPESAESPMPVDAKDASGATVAESKATPPLEVDFAADHSGRWTASLYGAGAVAENPVWRHEGTFKVDKRTMYAEFVAQLTGMSTEIAEQLRKAGVKGEPRALNPENMPDGEVEKRLGEMNFVSQYDAVRTAHRAMAEKVPSLDWYGVLVRGYSNLAMLTEHTWSSQHDAFAARALLYAERMVQLSNSSEVAQWHRAYARAIVGAHGSAIEQLDALAASESPKIDSRDAAADTPQQANEGLPPWTQLLAPYTQFDHKALQEVAEQHPELGETVALLQWQSYRSYMHGRWIYERGVEAMRSCPEAYGIYTILATWNALQIERMGLAAGMQVFGEQLPLRLADLQDLPEAVRPFTGKRESILSQFLGRRRQAAFSEDPMFAARELMAATKKETKASECSWAILAGLIAEEQFIQAANAFDVAGNAVEHSKQGLLEQLEPLVEEHRYAAFIRSFAYSAAEKQRADADLGQMRVVDPRANMNRLLTAVWRVPTATGAIGNELAWHALWDRNFTQSGLLDAWYKLGADWKEMRDEAGKRFAADFRRVSPHSPNALRLRWETAEKRDVTRLAVWEKKLKDDPVGWLTMGEAYHNLNELDAATRCYERSLAISSSYAATTGLANCYYHNGKKELWQPTLEKYLDEDDLSLSHAQIHQLIANENIANRQWQEAEPHAIAAAETYSSWGLLLASRVYEGLQQWEKSERYSSEATRSYPSYSSGTDWYFWCRRHGRGDLEAARELASSSIDIAQRSTYASEAYRVFFYRVLEGQPTEALNGLDQQIQTCPTAETDWDKVWRLLHSAAVAAQLKDDARTKVYVEQLHAITADQIKKSDPDWVETIDVLTSAFAGEPVPDDFLPKFDKLLQGADSVYQCWFRYLMGTALDQHGRTEDAESYWRRVAFGGPFDRHEAALAGYRLAERHGPERGGMPDELAKQDADASARFAEKNKEKESDDSGEAKADGEKDRSI